MILDDRDKRFMAAKTWPNIMAQVVVKYNRFQVGTSTGSKLVESYQKS